MTPIKATAARGALQGRPPDRVLGLPRRFRPLARALESGELSLSEFLFRVIVEVGDPQRTDYNDVSWADAVLSYLCRRPGVDLPWVEELMQRYGFLVLLRRTAAGRFARYVPPPYGRRSRPPVDEVRLRAELLERLPPAANPGAGTPLFDRSTKRQTMRATRYARSLGGAGR